MPRVRGLIDVPAGTFNPGECGREYHLCITLGSKDCCGNRVDHR